MANAIYPLYKQALLDGSINTDAIAGTVKASLIDTAVYTFSTLDQFFSDLSGIVGADQTLGTKTVTNGIFNCADPTWPSVTGATVEAFVIYIDTGVPATSRLMLFMDTGQSGLPVTPNGGDITYNIDVAGWFGL